MKKTPKDHQKKYKLKRKKLIKKADILWITAVLAKYGERCEVCGKSSGPPHHFWRKGNFGHLRFVVENGVPLCVKCHYLHHWAGDPSIHHAIIKKRGEKWYNELEKQARNPKKVFKGLAYYEKVLSSLRNRV